MPSVSPAQAHLMQAVKHGYKVPGGGGPSKAVATEFVHADMAKQHRKAKALRAYSPPQPPRGY